MLSPPPPPCYQRERKIRLAAAPMETRNLRDIRERRQCSESWRSLVTRTHIRSEKGTTTAGDLLQYFVSDEVCATTLPFPSSEGDKQSRESIRFRVNAPAESD